MYSLRGRDMWIWIVASLFVLTILFLIIKHFVNSPSNTSHNYRIEDCVSRDDLQFQVSYDTAQVILEVQQSKHEINEVLSQANCAVNSAWLRSYEKVLRISTTLDNNLKYHAARNLEYSKFQYYTNLHFRSMIAANITYAEYKKVDACCKELNRTFGKNKTPRKNMSISTARVNTTRNTLWKLRNTLLSRVRELNHQTGILRDKVGLECGERGKQWRAARMRNRK